MHNNYISFSFSLFVRSIFLVDLFMITETSYYVMPLQSYYKHDTFSYTLREGNPFACSGYAMSHYI